MKKEHKIIERNILCHLALKEEGDTQYQVREKLTKGFTLLELLVVVLIIGILAAVALPQYQKAVQKARALEAISMLKAIYNAQQIYLLANGTYTNDLTKLDIQILSDQLGRYAYANSQNPQQYSYGCTVTSCTACVARGPRFEQVLTRNELDCYAYSTDALGNSICAHLAGVQSKPSVNGFTYYKLSQFSR